MLVDFNNEQYETNIEPYLEHCFIVAKVPTNIFEYILLIVEIPTNKNEQWLFEVEYGFDDGHTETREWHLSDILKEYLKVEILDYILKTKETMKGE